MSREHPGLSETVLQECLDIWLLEHLTECGFSGVHPEMRTFRGHRKAVRLFAEQLAAFVWRMVEPQRELGFKPPFYGPIDQVREIAPSKAAASALEVIELCDRHPLCMWEKGHQGECCHC